MIPPNFGGVRGAPNQTALIGYDADRDAIDPRIAGYHFLRVVRLELVELAGVEQTCRAHRACRRAGGDPRE